MLQHLFESTVSALCYAIGEGHSQCGDGMLAPPYNDVARFVLRQHGNMPRFLGSAIQAATLLFALASLPLHGALFPHLPAVRRRAVIDAWAVSSLEPCRDLMKFYASLAVLALYSRPAEAQAG